MCNILCLYVAHQFVAVLVGSSEVEYFSTEGLFLLDQNKIIFLLDKNMNSFE